MIAHEWSGKVIFTVLLIQALGIRNKEVKKKARKLFREILISEPGPGQWADRGSLWSGKTELKMDFMFLFGKT